MDAMQPAELLLWLARSWVRKPWVWTTGLLLGMAPSLLVLLGPIGLSRRMALDDGQIYQLAFIGALVGAALGLAALESLRPLLASLGHVERAIDEAVVICAATLLFGCIPCFSALLSTGPGDGTAVVPALAWTLFHLDVM